MWCCVSNHLAIAPRPPCPAAQEHAARGVPPAAQGQCLHRPSVWRCGVVGWVWIGRLEVCAALVACMPCRVGTARHVQGSGRGIRPGMPCIQPTTPLVGTTAAAEGDDSLSTEEKALMRFQKQRMQEMAGERGLGGGPAFEGESSGEASPVPAHFGLITPCRSCSARCLHATHACATILGLQAASLRCRTRGRTCS